MKTYWGSGGITPRILDFGTRWGWVVAGLYVSAMKVLGLCSGYYACYSFQMYRVRPGGWLFWPKFPWFFSVPTGNCCDSTLKEVKVTFFSNLPNLTCNLRSWPSSVKHTANTVKKGVPWKVYRWSKYSMRYISWKFITVFTKARLWVLPWATSMQSAASRLTHLRSTSVIMFTCLKRFLP
jgi:hypothetical protein